jgi:hypothetical protein
VFLSSVREQNQLSSSRDSGRVIAAVRKIWLGNLCAPSTNSASPSHQSDPSAISRLRHTLTAPSAARRAHGADLRTLVFGRGALRDRPRRSIAPASPRICVLFTRRDKRSFTRPRVPIAHAGGAAVPPPHGLLESKLTEALNFANSLVEHCDDFYHNEFGAKGAPPHSVVQNPAMAHFHPCSALPVRFPPAVSRPSSHHVPPRRCPSSAPGRGLAVHRQTQRRGQGYAAWGRRWVGRRRICDMWL